MSGREEPPSSCADKVSASSASQWPSSADRRSRREVAQVARVPYQRRRRRGDRSNRIERAGAARQAAMAAPASTNPTGSYPSAAVLAFVEARAVALDQHRFARAKIDGVPR